MIATEVEPTCHVCGIPADASYFDDSSIAKAPDENSLEVVLAKYELHPNYCGELQYFAQYTDAYAASPAAVETPDLEWQIRSDGQPLAPWLTFRRIINPVGSIGVSDSPAPEGRLSHRAGGSVCRQEIIRLSRPTPVTQVGGRLLGRFWYNTNFGGR